MHTCISTVYSVGLHLLDLHNVWMPQLFVVDDLPLHILADLRIAPMLLRATGRCSDLQEDSPSGDALHLQPVTSRGTWCCHALDTLASGFREPAGRLSTLSPRAMNLMATCSPVVTSLASCTKPKAPLLRSATCEGRMVEC